MRPRCAPAGLKRRVAGGGGVRHEEGDNGAGSVIDTLS
jgi:hypothetical protein